MRNLLTHLKARRKSDEGFSMVELAFVLLLIALLIGIGVPTFLGIRERGQDSQATNALRQVLSTARATVLADNGNYPVSATTATELSAAEPQYTITDVDVAGPIVGSAGPDAIGVVVDNGGANNATLWLIAQSPSGTCFIISDNITSGTQYGEATGASTTVNPCVSASDADRATALAAVSLGDNW